MLSIGNDLLTGSLSSLTGHAVKRTGKHIESPFTGHMVLRKGNVENLGLVLLG